MPHAVHAERPTTARARRHSRRLLGPDLLRKRRVSEAQRLALGFALREPWRLVNVPDTQPGVKIERIDGHRITLRLTGVDTGRRGREPGAAGANVFVAVGNDAPARQEDWVYYGQYTGTRFVIDIASTRAAATVWLTAAWYSRRGASGPSSVPVRVCLPENMTVALGNYRAATPRAA